MMKTKFLTLLMAFAFVGIVNANCTVSTPCGDRSYDENNVTASVSSGLVTVKNENGEVIDNFECAENSVSVSCSGSGGDSDFNICDFAPDFLKPFLGC